MELNKRINEKVKLPTEVKHKSLEFPQNKERKIILHENKYMGNGRYVCCNNRKRMLEILLMRTGKNLDPEQPSVC